MKRSQLAEQDGHEIIPGTESLVADFSAMPLDQVIEVPLVEQPVDWTGPPGVPYFIAPLIFQGPLVVGARRISNREVFSFTQFLNSFLDKGDIYFWLNDRRR